MALLHVSRADRFGNCQIDGYPHMDNDMARAATTVIVTTEELVTDDEIRRRPDRTVIPGFLVDALVLAPFGAYPHEVWGRYHADFEHFAEYTADIDARGVTTAVADYLGEVRPRPGDLRGLSGPVRRRAAQARAGRRARAGAEPVSDAVTPSELLAVMGSRQLKDDTTVFAGVGVPLLAAALAQQRHAPKLTMVIEGGIIGPQIRPGRLPVSTNEMRAAHRAQMLPGITDTFLYAQRGFLDYGFMGGAQIDQYGNINTSVVGGDYWKPKVRLPGTGGANDIASLCREVFILTAHEKRRFVPRVDFVTSPAWLGGDDARRKAGLLFGGVSRVVTTLGVFGFEPDTRRMRVEAMHPGVTIQQIRDNTGFPLGEVERVAVTEPPSDDELSMLRALDPERRFLG